MDRRGVRPLVASFVLGCLATLLMCATAWMLQDTVRLGKRTLSHREVHLHLFLSDLRAGDILLGSGALWMQALSRSHITHVGILVRDPQSHQWSVWETARSCKNGAGLTPLAQFLNDWHEVGLEKEAAGNAHGRHSVLWHCRLGAQLDEQRLARAVESMRGSPYSMRLWKAFSTHVLPLSLDLPLLEDEHDAVERDTEMYCSQLAARTLQQCGALQPAGKPCHAYKPSDFWHSAELPWEAGFAPATQHHARIVFPRGRLSLQLFEKMERVVERRGKPAGLAAETK